MISDERIEKIFRNSYSYYLGDFDGYLAVIKQALKEEREAIAGDMLRDSNKTRWHGVSGTQALKLYAEQLREMP